MRLSSSKFLSNALIGSVIVVMIPAVIIAGVAIPFLAVVPTLHIIAVLLLLVPHTRISVVIRVGILVLIRVPMGVPLVEVLPILSIAIVAVLAILLGVPLLVIGLSLVALLVPIHFRPVILLLVIMFLVGVVLLLLLLLVILLHLRAAASLIARITLIRFRLRSLESFVQLFTEVRRISRHRHFPLSTARVSLL